MKSFKDLELALINRTVDKACNSYVSLNILVPSNCHNNDTRIEQFSPLPLLKHRKKIKEDALSTFDEKETIDLSLDFENKIDSKDEVIQLIKYLWKRLRWDIDKLENIIQNKPVNKPKEHKKTKLQTLSKLNSPPIIDDGRFCYCLAVPNEEMNMAYNPYNLKSVDMKKAKSSPVYWTVSATSISIIYQDEAKLARHNIDGGSNISLAQCHSTSTENWLREKTQFDVLCKIHTFKHFRMNLLRGLVRAEPVFQTCITAVHSLSESLLERLDLSRECSTTNLVPFHLDISHSMGATEFANRQQAQLDRFRVAVNSVVNSVVEMTLFACEKYGEQIQLDQYLADLDIHLKQSSTPTRAASDESADGKDNQGSTIHGFRIEIRRSMVQAREFLRVVDCQIVQLCHRLLVTSTAQLLQHLSAVIDDGQLPDEQVSMKPEEPPKTDRKDELNRILIEKKREAHRKKAIFAVELSLHSSSSRSESGGQSTSTPVSIDSPRKLSKSGFTALGRTKELDTIVETTASGDSRTETDSVDSSGLVTSYRGPSASGPDESRLGNLVQCLDRFDTNQEDFRRLLNPEKNEDETNEPCGLSLTPDPRLALLSLQTAVRGAETVLYSVQTISSRARLQMYQPAQYEFLRPVYQQQQEQPVSSLQPTVADSLLLVLSTDPNYCSCVHRLLQLSSDCLIICCQLLGERFRIFCQFVDEANVELLRLHERQDHQWELTEYQEKLMDFTEKLNTMDRMSERCRIGMVYVTTQSLYQMCRPFIAEVVDIVSENLVSEAAQRNDDFIHLIKTYKKRLEEPSDTVERFSEYLEFITKISADISSMEAEVRHINQLFTVIVNFRVSTSPEQIALYKTLNSAFQSLKNSIISYEAKKDENIRKFSQDLENEIEEIRKQILNSKGKLHNPEFLDPNQSTTSIIKQLGELKDSAQEAAKKLRSFSSYQEKFGSSLTKNANRNPYQVQVSSSQFGQELTAASLQEDVDDLERELSLRYNLWDTKVKWERWYDDFVRLRLDQTDVASVQNFVTNIVYTVGVLEKGLPSNEILPAVKHMVQDCRGTLPVILALRNSNLQARHWHKIEQLIGLSITSNTDFTIGDLMLSKVLLHKQTIIEISEFANNEMTLEQMLLKVQEVFTGLQFRLVCHNARQTWIITCVDEVLIELEESQITIATIKGSKYVESIKTKVEDWERKLTMVAKVIEEWISCQKMWLFLEQIFSTVDIQRQLVADTRLFNEADAEWRALMTYTKDGPLVLRSCTRQGVLQTLQICNGKLEKISHSLDEYLETKRVIFPRFFFLSNDELLEILSQVQDVKTVRPHLSKLFANVSDLLPSGLGGGASGIDRVVSNEGEIFPLPRSVRIRGLAEQWLEMIEQGLYESVKRQIKWSQSELKEREFIDWATHNFGQTILVSLQIQFSVEVTSALEDSPSEGADIGIELTRLDQLRSELTQKLARLASCISGDFPHHSRLSLEAMIITMVHNRDVAQHLNDNGVQLASDFEWRKQLRYSWDEFSSSVAIHQMNSQLDYGNEYLGCSPRLVITPLTDRCYLTMTGALQFNLGGCAKGPAGTGKTETIKDLSRSLGRQCVVFNCSDKLDTPTVAKLFSGIVQIGSWCCFDEFNRMHLEVLSVIAAQIYSIKAAKDASLDRFQFEGKEMRLNRQCGIFITMNPEYAGRVDLPDNLSSLFRPVAMMVPNDALICEVILLSEGFGSARGLASKVTSLYRLCAHQLSRPGHYDFGLRAIKAVLVLAGSLRLQRVQTDNSGSSDEADYQSELAILLLAIRSSNMPRLVAKDIPIFESLLKDLFPYQKMHQDGGSGEENKWNSLLEKSIRLGYEDLGLEMSEKQMQKVKHFHSQVLAKHGVIILGPSGSGKTVIRNVLQKALCIMPSLVDANNNEEEVDPRKIKTSQLRRGRVDVQVLNPRAVSISELYGFVDLNSFEWVEGLLAVVTKRAIKLADKGRVASTPSSASATPAPATSMDPGSELDSSISCSDSISEDPALQRKGSLLNVTLSRRLSIIPRMSLASHDPIEDALTKGTSKNEKSKYLLSEKNWQWLVLDGPIDTVWVENLNTVLDDSRTLCLANGERIGIPASLRYIFEVDDLKHTSPATVSRCAVVYISADSLEWQSLVHHWLNHGLPLAFPVSGRQYLWRLFEASVDRASQFKARFTSLQIAITGPGPVCQLQTLCAILGSLVRYMAGHGGYGREEENNPEDSTSILNTEKDANTKEREYFLEKNPKELNQLLGKMFVFAFVWSFGAAFERQDDTDIETTGEIEKTGSSVYEVAEEFDSFVREIFDNKDTGIKLPLNNQSIYSYFVDFEKGAFTPWEVLVPTTKSLIDTGQLLNSSMNRKRSHFIESLDTVRYSFLTALLLTNKHHVLLAGEIGAGKTSLLQQLLSGLQKKGGGSTDKQDTVLGKLFTHNDKTSSLLESIQNMSQFNDNFDMQDQPNTEKSSPVSAETILSYVKAYVKFNSQTSPQKAIQDLVSKLVKRGSDVVGPPKNKQMLLFIDDVHMPTSTDEYGTRPVLETLRQWLELGGFFDSGSTGLTWTNVTGTHIVAGMSANPHAPVSERLLKNFCVLTLPQPSFNSLQRIFRVQVSRLFQQQDFNADVRSQIPSLVSAAIAVYFKVRRRFKKSPVKFHYVFNLRSLHQMISSMKLAENRVVVDKDSAGKFLAHEMIREFHDRLTNEEDRGAFYKILADELHMYLKVHWSAEELMHENLMFSKFFPFRGASSSDKVYQAVGDREKLYRALETAVINVRSSDPLVNQFIFFKQSIEHIIRIYRILQQSRGHLLLIGSEGGGKYANVKLATALSNCDLHRLTMTLDYNTTSFRTDVKKIIDKSILCGRHCVLYLTDVNDLAEQTFMDDLGCLLSSGEVPDLYEADEMEAVLNQLRSNESVSSNDGSGPEDGYSRLIQRVNQLLHLVISVSPSNTQSREMLKKHPDVINCCTIDWYDAWTGSAYTAVAHHRIADVVSNLSLCLGDLDTNKLVDQLTERCKDIFQTAVSIGQKFERETRRRYFITAGHFVDFLNVFAKTLTNNYKENLTNRQRLETGLNQLKEAKILIAQMKEELTELAPKIIEKTEETKKLLVKLQENKNAVSEVEAIVKEEETIISLETQAVDEYSQKCTEDLQKAMEVLRVAKEALNSLDKYSVSEMYRELKTFTNDPQFDPEKVQFVSQACKSLCQWVLALESNYNLHHVVKPKQRNVEDANKALEMSRDKLALKQNQLAKVENYLMKLDQKYQNSLQEQKDLKERERLTNERLIRASALIQALQSEKSRWEDGLVDCDMEMQFIAGHSLLAAGYIVFCGSWSSQYREEARTHWIALLDEGGTGPIQVRSDFRFLESQFSRHQVLDWHNEGLPRDTGMAENVAIMQLSDKWSLLIDPQRQGKSFLQQSLCRPKVVSSRQRDYVQVLERAVRVGDSVLLEDIESHIDPALGPLVRREVYRKNNVLMIRMGDNEIEYSPSFRLYFLTSLANPPLESSVGRLVAIINFTVNMTGLQEQLLSMVVSMERPEVERERSGLLLSYAGDLRHVRELEDRTLSLLQASPADLVADPALAQALAASQQVATETAERLQQTQLAEQQLQTARELYSALARRGVLLYFVLTELGRVSSMYQFSLEWLRAVFADCVTNSDTVTAESGESETTRQRYIMDGLTYQVYQIVSEAIFSQHKSLLSFMLTTAIMRHSEPDENGPNSISPTLWTTFVGLHTGTAIIADSIKIYAEGNAGESEEICIRVERPALVDWLSAEIWNKCKYLETRLPRPFSGLCCSLASWAGGWAAWRDDSAIWTNDVSLGAICPARLEAFEKLMLISILAPARLPDSVLMYVTQVLGARFAGSHETDLRQTFAETPARTPIVFLLGPNSDPANQVQRLAGETRGGWGHLDMISMGRGQAVRAEALIHKTGVHRGRWVYLQNCDLMLSWLPSLQRIIEGLQHSKLENDPNFKLIISTHPHKEFPLGILQMARKIAIESPVGIKNQLLKSFALDGSGSVNQTFFDSQSQEMRRIVFSLCLFNSALLERRHYGSLGLNRIYDFNNSDLDISIWQLETFLADEDMQWPALQQIVGGIHYGGRVTDPLDARCLLHFLRRYQNPTILDEKGSWSFLRVRLDNFSDVAESLRSESGDALDGTAMDTLLGLGSNAARVRQEGRGRAFLRDVLLQQSGHHDSDPGGINFEGGSEDINMRTEFEILKMLQEKIPISVESVMYETYGKQFVKLIDSSMNPLLHINAAIKDDLTREKRYNIDQEVIYTRFFNLPYHNILSKETVGYNKLLKLLHEDIAALLSYLAGERSISEELEAHLSAIGLNLVPERWNRHICSSKPLSEWALHLRTRVDFVALWTHQLLTAYHHRLGRICSRLNTEKEMGPESTHKDRSILEKDAVQWLSHNDTKFKDPDRDISCYWLPVFLSQKSFLMAILQTEARSRSVPVDSLSLSSRVANVTVPGLDSQEDLLDVSRPVRVLDVVRGFVRPVDTRGTFVFGIYLDNAVWSMQQGRLAVSVPGQNPSGGGRYCKLPLLHMMPVSNDPGTTEAAAASIYHCPLYKTPLRTADYAPGYRASQDDMLGFLELQTEKSSNHDDQESFWVIRGTAALLECDND